MNCRKTGARPRHWRRRWGENSLAPAPDQVEITLFGPGYGECAVVHLGNNQWLVVDSCIDSETRQPAALAYFQTLGVNPAEAVRLILATHWHDDHIRGLSQVVAECRKARFCCSAALTHTEFLATVLAYEQRSSVTAISSGVRKIFRIYEQLKERPKALRVPIHALSNKRVLTLPAGDSGHGAECEVWTLSPSDRQYQRFLDELTRLMPAIKETKRRATPQTPNHVSVVAWISIGAIALLLGADLEETGEEGAGWSVIVASTERPQGRAMIFKIPHHGSATAHSDEVWRQMITPRPYVILSPYRRGRHSLPSPEDIQRIQTGTDRAYITAPLKTAATRTARPAPVIRTIRETVGQLRAAQPRTGWVRLRNGGCRQPDAWDVELSKDACHLSQLDSAQFLK